MFFTIISLSTCQCMIVFIAASTVHCPFFLYAPLKSPLFSQIVSTMHHWLFVVRKQSEVHTQCFHLFADHFTYLTGRWFCSRVLVTVVVLTTCFQVHVKYFRVPLLCHRVSLIVCRALLEVHKQVSQQRDDCYAETEVLRRSATPRWMCHRFYQLKLLQNSLYCFVCV